MDSVAQAGNLETSHFSATATVNSHSDPFLSRVLQSFNTWAFKREQPCRPQMLARTVARAIERRKAIDFVLYWGKGPRSAIAAPDLQCLDYLGALAARVQAIYPPGVAFNLVLTDTHAKLNGHSAESMASYFAEVRREAGRRGFACHLLGQLTAAAAIAVEAVEDTAPAEVLASLTQSAMRWYRGEGTALDGAAMYYRLNMIEKRVIEKTFPDSVFVTFNGSDQRDLFPDGLAIFYMYSTKRGTAVKPWFQEVGGEPEKPGLQVAPA